MRGSPRRGVAVALLLVVAGAAAPATAGAQYFGRNAVQYDRFDFQILKSEHFDVYYYGDARAAAVQAARMAERWYARLSRLLNHELRGRQALMTYASHPEFRQTTVLLGEPGEATGGATEVFKRRMVLPFAGPLSETDHVIGHELVHAFQFDMTGRDETVSRRSFPRALLMPLWFIEGMAEYLSVGSVDPHTTMWIRDAAANDRLPSMRQLDDPRYFPYRFGQAFWAYIAGRWGDGVVGRILNAAARSGSPEAALERVLGVPVDTVNAEWQAAIGRLYGRVSEAAQPPAAFAEVLLSRENSGRLNTSPALSPDGTELVFLSERDLFAIDMYRADAATGEILDKIIEAGADPHLESLQFIRSAGAWDPAGRRFAFGGVAAGDAVLRILDVEGGDVVAEKRLSEVGEILNPTWSPDGRRVAFAAVVGGLSDLYVYDLERERLRRLTDDAFADLQPAWSPDGAQIAFVTDRFTTDLSRLAYGSYRLALIDPESAEIQALPGFPTGKHLNPQWRTDGASVYFIADPEGVANVYRLDVRDGRLFQVTDVHTGVTGITALSPALSAAAAADKIAFSVYERGSYTIYTVEARDILDGRPVRPGA